MAVSVVSSGMATVNLQSVRGNAMIATDMTNRQKLVEQGSIDVPEACRLTGLGRTFLYSLMERGQVRFCKVGKRRLIPRSEITRLLAESLVGE
jgi:excisionase family DNA binding protein